jgi:hypothetical protein
LKSFTIFVNQALIHSNGNSTTELKVFHSLKNFGHGFNSVSELLPRNILPGNNTDDKGLDWLKDTAVLESILISGEIKAYLSISGCHNQIGIRGNYLTLKIRELYYEWGSRIIFGQVKSLQDTRDGNAGKPNLTNSII